MIKKDGKISIEDELYGTRLLVFMEDESCSNRYRQVLLGPEEFKRVSGSIGRETGRKLDVRGEMVDVVDLDLSDETYVLPDLREIHEDDKDTPHDN